MRVLVPARRDVGEDSDGDNLEQQHQGIGEAALCCMQDGAGRQFVCPALALCPVWSVNH